MELEMAKKFSYQSDDYDRQTQRFVIPLYIKDNLNNYEYSSTGTLITYNEHYYILFAAHALAKNDDIINDIYFFSTDGSLNKILDFSIGYKIYHDEDIVIDDHFNNRFNGKNYFNLNLKNLSGFDKHHFAWTGFPLSKSKSKKIHNSKSEENLKEQYIHFTEDNIYFKNAKYFTIVSRIESKTKNFIKGKYNRKNTKLKYQGDVQTAPSPRGMSGGAMYFFAKGEKLKNTLDETFRFAGIGIEYKNDKTIVGVYRDKIIELIDLFNKENPVQFIPQF
jgi:hypothetical protein